MGKIINAERSKGFICYASAELVEGRKVLDVTYLGGAQGMGGGYGFLGLKLKKARWWGHEWLVCALYGAADWFTIGTQWLAAHPAQYSEQIPLMGYGWRLDEQGHWIPTGKNWDRFKPMVVGQELKKFHCEKESCQLVIGEVVVEIVKDPHKRPIYYGSKELRQLEPGEALQRAWIIIKDPYVWIS